MNFEGKITCEPGRTIYIDGAPAFYVNIARNSKTAGDYYLAPWQADSIARQIAAAMRAGMVRVPRDLADGKQLDEQLAAAEHTPALENALDIMARAEFQLARLSTTSTVDRAALPCLDELRAFLKRYGRT